MHFSTQHKPTLSWLAAWDARNICLSVQFCNQWFLWIILLEYRLSYSLSFLQTTGCITCVVMFNCNSPEVLIHLCSFICMTKKLINRFCCLLLQPGPELCLILGQEHWGTRCGCSLVTACPKHRSVTFAQQLYFWCDCFDLVFLSVPKHKGVPHLVIKHSHTAKV